MAASGEGARGAPRLIYLDNNATTMVAPEVLEAMLPFFSERYGNPSSMHRFGGAVRADVEGARAEVAELLGAASPSEIVFTGGGSEGDNLAIRGTLEALAGKKRHIVTTRVEHPAVRETCRHLQKLGYRLTELGVDVSGALDLDELAAAVTPDTALVSIMWANNETGVVFPIEKAAEIVKARGAVFHTDAVQAAGKLEVDLKKVPIDLLSISGHKLHAPKGIGALYVRRGTKIVPLVMGGHQEGGKRAGTENVAAIVGLGVACGLATQHRVEETKRIKALRDRLEAGILSRCKQTQVNGRNRLPNTLNVSFEFVEGEAILMMLDDFGIAASSGSACASGSLEPSHVMRAMGIPFTAAHGSIRFSLSRYNTEEEVDFVVDKIPAIIERLREISPFASSSAWQGTPIGHGH
jgi:cysteine desulfurase